MDWTTLCPAAEADLGKVLTALHAEVPDMWSDVRCAENDSFPFWVYASLNTAGATAAEDVVLSASFKWTEDGIHFSCDISSGEGLVLADGLVSTLIGDEEYLVDKVASTSGQLHGRPGVLPQAPRTPRAT